MPSLEYGVDDSAASLRWSAWMPLMGAHPLALAQLPSEPGIYRIRAAGGSLLHVGYAAHGVRTTMERLSRQVHLPVEPYNDPDVPARHLWHERRRYGAYEVSGAPCADPAMVAQVE